MRITRKKLIQLIKEELAQEVSMEGSLEEAAPDPTSPIELCKRIVLLIRTGSPAEDQMVKALLDALSAAAGEGAMDTNSKVRMGLERLMAGLAEMAKNPEPEAQDDESHRKERHVAPE